MDRIEERTHLIAGRGAARTSCGGRTAAHDGAAAAVEGRAVWPLTPTRQTPEASAGSCGDRAPVQGSGASAGCVRRVPSGIAPARHVGAARVLRRALDRRRSGDDGAATAEYAIATMAAVAFAGLLVVILQSDEVRGMLLDLVRRALTYDR
jgi:hypothetical protein